MQNLSNVIIIVGCRQAPEHLYTSVPPVFPGHGASLGTMWCLPAHAALLPALPLQLAHSQHMEGQGQVADCQIGEYMNQISWLQFHPNMLYSYKGLDII